MRTMTVLLALLLSPAAAYSQTATGDGSGSTAGFAGFSFGESLGFSSHKPVVPHAPRRHKVRKRCETTGGSKLKAAQ